VAISIAYANGKFGWDSSVISGIVVYLLLATYSNATNGVKFDRNQSRGISLMPVFGSAEMPGQ
jgi:hypothetical protein